MNPRGILKVFLSSLLLAGATGCTGSGGGADPDDLWLSSQFSWGLCAGECVFTLTRAGADLELSACSHDNVCTRTNLATLTAEGLSELEARETALSGVPLEPRYGCPDCADGGTTIVQLSREGENSSHTYSNGAPPEPLADLDALVEDLFTGLRSCTASPLIELDATCQPID